MKQIYKFRNSPKAESFVQRTSKPQTSISQLPIISSHPSNCRFIKRVFYQTPSSSLSPPNLFPAIINLFTEKDKNYLSRLIDDEHFVHKTSELADELIRNDSDSDKICEILESKGCYLCRRYPCGLALVLQKLRPWPHLALEVFNWRRKEADAGLRMVAEEYAAGITVAGRIKNIDLAVMLFQEASTKGIKASSTYNALMGAYMYNGLAEEAQSLFREMKTDVTCGPTIVTYNILLTIFGRSLMVPHMEETFREIKKLNLTPNLNTYNYLIAGYVTAWMWDDMERVYRILEKTFIEPDHNTHLLMLRGYAHSGNLEKMEATYELIKHHVNENESSLIRAMVCAYCKSSDRSRVVKVESLLKLIPEEEYRPWLNAILIRFYAQEDLMDGMENYINQAFEHKTSISTVGVMRPIITTYFRRNALEKYTDFLKQAESSGWRICRSLYHCKMVMFSSANRVEEMENVLDEMKTFNIDPTKKTFWIMYKAYSKWGQTSKLQKLLGIMCKHGFGIPKDAFSS